MLPLTHAWSRAQKCLLIAAVLIALAAFSTLVYSVERRYRPPDGNRRFGRSSKFFQTSFAFAMQSETILSNASNQAMQRTSDRPYAQL
jgi:hypothetical protein